MQHSCLDECCPSTARCISNRLRPPVGHATFDHSAYTEEHTAVYKLFEQCWRKTTVHSSKWPLALQQLPRCFWHRCTICLHECLCKVDREERCEHGGTCHSASSSIDACMSRHGICAPRRHRFLMGQVTAKLRACEEFLSDKTLLCSERLVCSKGCYDTQ